MSSSRRISDLRSHPVWRQAAAHHRLLGPSAGQQAAELTSRPRRHILQWHQASHWTTSARDQDFLAGGGDQARQIETSNYLPLSGFVEQDRRHGL
jgi:hypothetical protein